MKNLLIIGASGFGVDVYTFAQQSIGYLTEFQFKGFLDVDKNALSHLSSLPQVLCSEDEYEIQDDDVFVCSVGNVKLKNRIIEKMKSRGAKFTTLIHNTATVMHGAIIGEGSILLKNAFVGCNAKIGEHTLIQLSTVVGHDCEIGSFCRIDCNAVCVGGVKVKDNVTIHTSSVINHKVTIGKNSTVGACSFVIRNVKEGNTVFGNPAKAL